MDWYHLALFVHLSALLAAMGASGLAHFSEMRLRAARLNGELRDWARLANRLARVFPVALLTLVASGAFMLAHAWSWRAGWVDAALGGMVALFVSGIVQGQHRTALLRTVERDVAAHGEQTPLRSEVAEAARESIPWLLSWGNTALAVGIVFIMVTKPEVAGAIGALALAAGVGIGVAVSLDRKRSTVVTTSTPLAEARIRDSA